jgi:hypothetical protein
MVIPIISTVINYLTLPLFLSLSENKSMKTLLVAPILTISLFVTPPEKPLDQSSPGKFMSSLLFSKGNPLGKTVSEIKCQDFTESLTVNPVDLKILGPLFMEGRGLGLLFHTFPGRLENATPDLKDEKTKFIRIKINQGQCARLKNYLKDFREKKIAERFGLPHRPLMAEGATGASLGVSLLEVAGVMEQGQREAWETTLILPEKLSGMPLKDQYVSPFSLIGSSWGKNDSQNIVLKFWDPEKIRNWITEKAPNKQGLEIDKSHLPAPQGSHWKQANDPAYSKKKNQIP